MALKEEFQKWIGSFDEPPLVQFSAEDDGVATLIIGASPGVTLTVTPIVDGDVGVGFFVEADDASSDIEEWLSDANEFLMEQPKLTFAQCIDELIRRRPECLQSAGAAAARVSPGKKRSSSSVRDASPDDFEFEDDDAGDASGIIIEDENEAERDARRRRFAKEQEEAQKDEEILSTSQASLSRQAQQVLMREMKSLLMLKGDGASQAVQIDLVGERLDHWRASILADSFPECPLRGDLYSYGSRHGREPAVIMELMFPADFPLQPPFIRVIRPRFQMHSGHVTIGGSICMEALTPSGWMPTLALENIFVEIRSQMVEGGGRLDLANLADYSEAEAKEAFNRVASRYGWLKPK